MGTTNRRGVFRAYDGTLKAGAGELTIEAASLDTGNERRDRQLRSPDFFDVERHPWIVLTATAVTTSDRGVTVTGELAIARERVRLEIPADIERMPDGALHLEAETTVSRKAAGLAWNKLGMIRGDAAARPAHARTRNPRSASVMSSPSTDLVTTQWLLPAVRANPRLSTSRPCHCAERRRSTARTSSG